jgi:hypothetical protein
MKRIINTVTLEYVWRGTQYIVDGQPGIVTYPLALLDDVTAIKPPYDPQSQRLNRLPDRADLQNDQWIIGEMEAVNLTEDELAALARTSSRVSLRTIWDNLPAYIRGPYRPQFEAANRLLDDGDDEGAAALIQYATPCPDYDEEQADAFNAAKSTLLAGIESLPSITHI